MEDLKGQSPQFMQTPHLAKGLSNPRSKNTMHACRTYLGLGSGKTVLRPHSEWGVLSSLH